MGGLGRLAGFGVVLALAALPLLGCDSGDDSGDDGEPQTQIVWSTAPAETVAAGTPLSASFTVDTQGEVHVAQLQACMGEVPDCGVEANYDLAEYATEDAGIWTGALTLDTPGTWTVVAWAHVDEDPHLSDPISVSVQ